MTTSLPPKQSIRQGIFSRNPGFAAFILVRLTTALAVQVQTVAVGWQVYDISRDPFDLGLVGLTQFLPALALILVTGAVADRFPRGMVMGAALAVQAASATALLLVALAGPTQVWPIFLVMAIFGTARAFYNPAQLAVIPNIVSRPELASAVGLNSMALKVAMISGPVLGGLLYILSSAAAYAAALALFLAAALLSLRIPRIAVRQQSVEAMERSLVAGFRYLRVNRIVLGAISLDMFAVFMGGVTALLPVFARDILFVGPLGLGLLRACPAIGAIPIAFYLSIRPLRDRAGWMMFAAVAVFGLATIVFGLSTAPWLSALALLVVGAADVLSANVRQTIIQLMTPDHMRGRVSAISMVFVGVSNEVGEFRSGTMATFAGAVPAVVLGGAGTIAVAALWAKWFPQLLGVRHLGDRQ